MRLLPRTARGTWTLALAAWVGGCALAWWLLPPRPRAVITEEGTHWPSAFSPDGQWLVTRSYSGDDQDEFRFWDAATGQPAPHLPNLPTDGGRVSFSPDSHWFLADGRSVNAGGRVTLSDFTRGVRVAERGKMRRHLR